MWNRFARIITILATGSFGILLVFLGLIALSAVLGFIWLILWTGN